MRPLVLLFVGGAAAYSQPFTFGVKGGVPLTDFFNVASAFPDQSSALANTNRYVIGPTVELRLPAGLGVEFDALFRQYDYQTAGGFIVGSTSTKASSNAWEFPLLLKYPMPTRVVRPFIDAGVVWDHLQGLEATVTPIVSAAGVTTSQTSNPPELKNTTTMGAVVGAGLDIHALFLHISPEVRYTRWTSQHFTFGNVLNSNQNQAEFLLGITFYNRGLRR